MTLSHGKPLREYAEGAIDKLTGKLDRATSEAKIEKLLDRRDYWIGQWEKETGRDWDRVIGSVEDLREALPGLRIFEVSEMPEILDFIERYKYNEKPETD